MPDVLSKQDGPILEIILNRPDRGNGADDAMAIELTRLIEEAADGTKCILLRGAGADFCTGRVAAGPPPTGPGNAFAVRGFFEPVFNCYGAIRNSPIPVIAVVQGRALGFGCAIAAVADITLASDTATFQVPEMAHNILPTMVMSSFVDRIPRKAFTYLVYSTAVISAERALSFGIVEQRRRGRKARRRGGAGHRRHSQGPAARGARGEGIRTPRLQHAHRQRGRFRPQHPRAHQLVGGDATELGNSGHIRKNSK